MIGRVHWEYAKTLPGEAIRKAERRLLGRKIQRNRYAGRPVLTIEEGNAHMKNVIRSGIPYMITRFGANEAAATVGAILRGKIGARDLLNLAQYAGFFPEEESAALRFADLMIEASALIDMDALYYMPGEEFLLRNYAKNAKLVHNRAIEPWYSMRDPWTGALQGKKVLVVHPFRDTILAQYRRREALFPGSGVLPEFELRVVPAVQTIAGERDPRFRDWFAALDWMYAEAMRRDFDVAVLGCGAYGLPLAGMLKRSGKIAIHLGGATQLLFGIKGGRWDSHPVVSRLYNEAWTRPARSERPAKADAVEDGCYW